MRIGEAAARAGVSADTIRHYERLRLLPPPARLENGYREYPDDIVRRIVLIRNAVQFGFSLKDLAGFLLARDTSRPPCQQVRASAQQLLADVERQIRNLMTTRASMRRTLREWDVRLQATRPGAPARLLEAVPALPREPGSRSSRMMALRRRRV
jgi:DNA-binding transcriptional MerR regulator